MKSLPLMVLLACGVLGVAEQHATDPLRGVAERYVKLVLALGLHDADYVDAYYGPPEWRKQVEAEKMKMGLPEIEQHATMLRADLAKVTLTVKTDGELWRL